MNKRIKIYLLLTLVTGGLTLGLVLRAQVWYGPAGQPPLNVRADGQPILDVSQLGGDDLGDHTATYDLDMMNFAISGVASSDSDPAISAQATTTGAVTLKVDSAYGPGIKALNNGASPTISIINASTAPGLVVDVTGPYSALIKGRLTVIGNILLGDPQLGSLATVTSSAATDKLFFGSGLLCDQAQTNCGFSAGAVVADNLGTVTGVTKDPHVARMDLELDDNVLSSIRSNDGNPALEVSNLAPLLEAGPATFITSSSTAAETTAVYAQTFSSGTIYAGLYGFNASGGPGILAASESGQAANIYGRLKFDEAADRLVFHDSSQVLGYLSLTPGLPARQDLYWGDKLLCDANEPNCGWGSAAVTTHWKQNANYAPNIYYDQGKVGIGYNEASYLLDVEGLTQATGAYLGSLRSVTVLVDKFVQVGNDLALYGNMTITARGLLSAGDLSIAKTGATTALTIGGVTLTETQLISIIDKCRAAGYCT